MVTRGRKKRIKVSVARTGTRSLDVVLDDDKTVEAALEEANLVLKNSEETYVNSEPVELDYELESGDRVVLAKSIEGAR